jgi:DNA recombination protein RmuC
MQNILPVLCFIAGFGLSWLVLRWRQAETETAFKALSSDALARNNQAFLDLARSALAETQQAARGDLEMRQQAISAMVTPVRASLEKVDSKIQ